MNNIHPLANYIHSFFNQHLALEKGLSPNSILAYRDTIKLLLCFASGFLKKKVDQINLEELDEKLILAFLDYIEKERKCSPKTRNLRLAAIRTFFNFIGRKEPVLLNQCRQIRSIPLKKTVHKTIDYLESNEMQALLDVVDVNSSSGLRDKALFMLLYNTGARVSEVANIKLDDLRLEQPSQIKILGKGKKQRACPLWPETVAALKIYIKYRKPKDNSNEYLFLNTNGLPITRFGIGHITKKYALKASEKCKTISEKRVSPHTFRHSTAMSLLESGNDINMVKLWLGHSDINTTHMYIELNMEMKRRILDNCKPLDSNNQELTKLKKWQQPGILKWLNNLSENSKLCEVGGCQGGIKG